MSGAFIQLVDLYLPTKGSWEPQQQQRQHMPAARPGLAYPAAWRAQHSCLCLTVCLCPQQLQLGMGAVHEYEEGLARQLYEELSGVPGIRILGPPPDVPEVGAAA